MKGKFGLRTILIPILAVAAFYMIQIVVSVVYILVLMLVTSNSAGGFDPSTTDQFLEDTTTLMLKHSSYISGIYSIIIIGFAVLAIRLLLRSNPFAVRRERPGTGQFVAAILTILGAAGMVTLLMFGIQELAKVVPAIDTALNNYIELSQNFIGNGNIPVVILTTCIAVPIAEDLVFRGVIQGELRRAMPGWAAVLIQGVIFALVHGDPIQISYVIIPAIFLGAVYEWTKSIYVPIAMHMAFNFVGSVIPLMLADSETASGIFVIAEFIMIPFAIIAMVFLYKRRKIDLPDLAFAGGMPDHMAFATASASAYPMPSMPPTPPMPPQASSPADPAASVPQPPAGTWKHRDNM